MALQFPRAPYIQPTENIISKASEAFSQVKKQQEADVIKKIDKELSDYFIGNSMAGDSGFSVVSGDLTYNAQNKIPTFNEGWQKYKSVFEKYGKDVGMDGYMAYKQAYSQMTEMHANQLKGDIMRWTNAGYSEKEIRKALGNNPFYLDNYSTLVSDPLRGVENSGWMAPYGPRKSLIESLSDSPGVMAGAGATALAAGEVGRRYLSKVSESDMETAKTTYKGKIAKSREILNKALASADVEGDKAKDAYIKKVKETAAYKKASGAEKGRLTRNAKKVGSQKGKAVADKLKEEANAKFRKQRGDLDFKPKTRAQKVAKYVGKTPMMAKGLAYGTIPSMVEGAIETISEDEDIAKIGGEGTAATMTAAQAIQSGAKLKPALNLISKKIKEKGLTTVIKTVFDKGGIGLASRTLAKAGLGTLGGAVTGGVLTAAMAAWTLKDLYDIAQIIEDM
tara:strand:+ start:231 stop:1580 length:1350 start_codon:yes stop_codon:yes gene_type:complete